MFTGYRKTRMADQTMICLLRHMGTESSVHGMRSAFRDWAGNVSNFPHEVVETALAYVIGDKAEQAYRRSDALEKRRILSFNSDTRGRAGFGEAV